MAESNINLVGMQQAIEARWKEDETRRKRWARYRAVYEGEYWDTRKMPKEYSRIDCGKLFATVSQLAPLMTDSRPVWSVTARDPAMQPLMAEFDKALQFLWDKLRMTRKLRAAYQDALLMEQGCLQIDYDDEEDEVRIGVVDPRHLVFQQGGHDDLEDCAWVAKRRTFTVGDLRRRYPDHADEIISDTDKQEADEGIQVEHSSSDPFEATNRWVVVYEVWLRDDTVEDDLVNAADDGMREPKPKRRKRLKYPNGRFIVFTRTGRENKPVKLADYASPFGHGKPPFVMVYDYRLSHSVWGLGEGRHLMPVVNELNDVLQSISFKLRNTCRNNYLIDADQVDEKLVRRTFKRGGQFFVRKKGSYDRNTPALEPVQDNPPLQVEFQYIQILERIAEDLTSVTDIVAGQAAKRERQTAQEFSGLFEAGHTRTRMRVRMFEESIEDVLGRVLSLMQEGYTRPHYYMTEDAAGGQEYNRISNRREDAMRITDTYVDDQFRAQEHDELEAPQVDGEEDESAAKAKALAKLIAAMPVDESEPVLAKFDLTVQSKSTLPTDIQSNANLALRLAQLGIIDATDTLEKLNWPGRKQIIERMRRDAAMAEDAAARMNVGAGGQDAATYGTETGIEPPALPAPVQ